MDALEQRYRPSTRKLDRSYWRKWKEWCALVRTPPLRVNQAANSGAVPELHQREVALALGGFMFFVSTGYDASGRRYKVESMLARLRGVARRHKAMGLTF
eukprot:769160-Pleurochrysis_carterae.AAC.1